MKNIKAFTLIEAIIVVSIIIILSSIAAPVYRKHVMQAKKIEGYAVLSSIRDFEQEYFSEYKCFFNVSRTCYDRFLNMNIRSNKYFTNFQITSSGTHYLAAYVFSQNSGNFTLKYDITAGVINEMI